MKIKKILAMAWPFLGLAFFLAWGWIYIKPMLPENFISLDISKKKEVPAQPDAKYDFLYSHKKLQPTTVEQLALEEKFIDSGEIVKKFSSIIKAASSEELINAISIAADNDLVQLTGGEYEVNLIIDKNLTIAGQGENTVLAPLDKEKAILYIKSNEVVIKNFQIKDARIGIEAYGAKITIENVKFMNLAASACYVKDSELIFKDSYIYNSGSAIKALSSSGEISRAIIKNNRKSGIEVRNSKFKIFNNIITENGSYGVFADQNSEVEIKGNYIDNNTGFEVRIEGKQEIYR